MLYLKMMHGDEYAALQQSQPIVLSQPVIIPCLKAYQQLVRKFMVTSTTIY